MSELPTIGFGLTTWRAPQTLAATLSSYHKKNLSNHFDQTLLNLQEASADDLAVAREYGYPFCDGPNIGIGSSLETIARKLKTDLVLFLENDCPLSNHVSSHDIADTITTVRTSFAQQRAKIFRLRHRWDFGEGFAIHKYLETYPVRNLHPKFLAHEILAKYPAPSLFQQMKRAHKRKTLLGRAIYLEEYPEKKFPQSIQLMSDGPAPFHLTDSRHLNWTNQSVVVERKWFLEILLPYIKAHPTKRTHNGFQCPEPILNNSWWRRQNFPIAVPTGLFTHERRDGSWRPSHHRFEESCQNSNT